MATGQSISSPVRSLLTPHEGDQKFHTGISNHPPDTSGEQNHADILLWRKCIECRKPVRIAVMQVYFPSRMANLDDASSKPYIFRRADNSGLL